MKICTKCLEEKELDEFTTKTGNVTAHCRSCKATYQREWARANREKVSKYKQKSYQDNLEHNRKRVREAARRFSENNPESKRASQQKYRQNNRDAIAEKNKEYARQRYRANREREIERTRTWRQENKETYRESCRKSAQKQYENDREKYRARILVYRAIKAGQLTRPNICSRCKKKCRPEGHHTDYNKPLDVIWLCRTCHRDIHNGE